MLDMLRRPRRSGVFGVQFTRTSGLSSASSLSVVALVLRLQNLPDGLRGSCSANGGSWPIATILRVLNAEYFVDLKWPLFALNDNKNIIAQLTALGRLKNF